MTIMNSVLNCISICSNFNTHVIILDECSTLHRYIKMILCYWYSSLNRVLYTPGGGPRVVVSTAAFHARVRGSVPGLGGLIETKMFLPHPRVKVSIVGSLRDQKVACSASDRQGSNSESCVCRTVSSQSSHHPQEVLLAPFSLYVHKGGLKPDSFHFILLYAPMYAMLIMTKTSWRSRVIFRLWPIYILNYTSRLLGFCNICISASLYRISSYISWNRQV